VFTKVSTTAGITETTETELTVYESCYKLIWNWNDNICIPRDKTVSAVPVVSVVSVTLQIYMLFLSVSSATGIKVY